MNKFAMIIFVYALVGCGSSSFSGDSDAAKIQKGQTAVPKGEEHSEIKE